MKKNDPSSLELKGSLLVEGVASLFRLQVLYFFFLVAGSQG